MNFIKQNKKQIIIIAMLVIIALVSVFGISKVATNPENYKATIQSIDEKKSTVMGVTAGAAATSTLLAAIPGDATTPIANQIMQLSSYLLIVVGVLMLEKSLLTVMGFLAFCILIPVACGVLAVYTFCEKKILIKFALKLVAFALIIVTIIPISLKIGDMVCDVNSIAIEQATEGVDEIAEVENEENSLLDKIINKFTSGVSDAGDYAKEKLNRFIDAIAVFLIAYCVIPIIVVITMIWLIKFLFGARVSIKPRERQSQLLK